MHPITSHPRRGGVTLADMSSDRGSRGRTVAITLGLFVASLLALHAGGFILFDDRSGFGTDTSGPLLVLAVLLAGGSLRTGLPEPTARRALGGALALLDAAIVTIGASDDGFRFFWTTYEGELLQFEVVLGLVALVLLAPSYLTRSGSAMAAAGPDSGVHDEPHLSTWARASLYLCALAGALFAAFVIGTAHFEATQCSGPDFGGECDLAGLEGLLWSSGALVLGVVAIIVNEVVLARRRRAARSSAGVR